MSDILVAVPDLEGESALPGYEGQIECMAMRHAIDLPVVSRGSTRVEGASRHGPVELDHSFDLASAGLRMALSAGQNLGKLTITRMRMLGGASVAAEIITLNNVYVVRIDLDTPVNPATGRSSEDPMETFFLEYGDITWDYKKHANGVEVGSVQGAWSAEAQTTSF